MSGIAEPQRLVDIGRIQNGSGFDTFGYPDLVDVRDNVKSLDRVFGYRFETHHVRVNDASRRVLGFGVSATYFDALGVGPVHGRLLQADDDSDQGGAAVAVVSHAFFERELGGDLSRRSAPRSASTAARSPSSASRQPTSRATSSPCGPSCSSR
jgi:putative ABC transport system permease protein